MYNRAPWCKELTKHHSAFLTGWLPPAAALDWTGWDWRGAQKLMLSCNCLRCIGKSTTGPTGAAAVLPFYVAWVRRKPSGGLKPFSIFTLILFPFGIILIWSLTPDLRGDLTLDLVLLKIQGQPGKLLRPLRTWRCGVLRSNLESGETFHQSLKLGFRLCCARPLRSYLQVQESACSHHHRSNKSSIQLSINSIFICLFHHHPTLINFKCFF